MNRSSASQGCTTIWSAAGQTHEDAMSFATVRHTLFTVHMWVGLILGLLLAILGLSGSLLVYDETISDWISPPPRATTIGQPLPLSMITGIARDAAAGQGLEMGGVQILVPQSKTDAVIVRFNGISPMGYQIGRASCRERV